MSILPTKILNYGKGSDGLGFSIEAGIKKGNFVFLSGAGAIGPDGRVPLELRGDPAGQTRMTLEEVDRILKEAGGSLNDGVMFTVFLKNAAHFHLMNDVWTEFFHDIRPTRTTVESGLMDPDLLVEINAIALLSENDAATVS